MIKGINKAGIYGGLLWEWRAQENKSIRKRPCVFLSHKSEDKPACREIAEYLSNAEIDYYLDELDEKLQQAAIEENAYLITDCLKKAIRGSTHMMVIISAVTFTSPWIPFEIGFGHATIVGERNEEDLNNKNIRLSVLTLKDISEIKLPDFLKTSYEVRGTKSLNEYVAKISEESEDKMLNERLIVSNNNISHSLDNILNWKL